MERLKCRGRSRKRACNGSDMLRQVRRDICGRAERWSRRGEEGEDRGEVDGLYRGVREGNGTRMSEEKGNMRGPGAG